MDLNPTWHGPACGLSVALYFVPPWSNANWAWRHLSFSCLPFSLSDDRLKFQMLLPFGRRTPPWPLAWTPNSKSKICELKPSGVPDLERSHAIFLDPLDAMKGSKLRVVKAVIRFFESTLMGCFFSCFRIKDDARRKTGSGPDLIVSDDGVCFC